MSQDPAAEAENPDPMLAARYPSLRQPRRRIRLAIDFAMIQPKLSYYYLIALKGDRGLNCFEHASLLLL
jgi:hypothetical protein